MTALELPNVASRVSIVLILSQSKESGHALLSISLLLYDIFNLAQRQTSHANFAHRLRLGHFRSSNSISVQTKPTIFIFYKSLCRFSSSLVKDMSVISRFLLGDGIGKAIFFSLFSIHISAILFKQANRV